MRQILIALLLSLSCGCASKDIEADNNLPQWFEKSFTKLKLGDRYQLSEYLSPSYFSADFNGDSATDVAVLIKETSSSKSGILILHSSKAQHNIFGAGTDFGPGGDDYSWMNHWMVSVDTIAHRTLFDSVSGDLVGVEHVKLMYPALVVQDRDADDLWTGGVIVWDGKQYNWIHRGE